MNLSSSIKYRWAVFFTRERSRWAEDVSEPWPAGGVTEGHYWSTEGFKKSHIHGSDFAGLQHGDESTVSDSLQVQDKNQSFQHAVFHLCDIFPDLKRHFCSCLCSASMCSHSNGLESLGLADIRILVRLMTLAAGGRAHTCVDRQSCLTGLATDRHNTSCLRFLTSAIGSVISQSSTAYRQLVEICTQVSLDESITTRVSY